MANTWHSGRQFLSICHRGQIPLQLDKTPGNMLGPDLHTSQTRLGIPVLPSNLSGYENSICVSAWASKVKQAV